MTRARTTALAVLLTGAAATGCAPSPGGSLDTQPATPSPACRVHQTKEPADRYRAGTHADTRSILELMHYYTANGTKTFCDGKPPTSTDRKWTDLYTRLGGSAGHIAATFPRTP